MGREPVGGGGVVQWSAAVHAAPASHADTDSVTITMHRTTHRMNATTTRMSRSPLAAAAVLGVSILAAGAINSFATATPSAAVAPAPTAIALIDLPKLINGLTELAEKNAEVGVRRDQLQKQLDELDKQIKQIDTELNDVIPKNATKQRTEKLAQKFEIESLQEARAKAYQRLIDLENGDIIRDLYGKIQASIEAFAKKEGFDLVLLDDRAIQIPTNRVSIREINPIIESKRILFAKDGMDVTDRLLTIMNNEYKANMKR